MKKIRVLVVDDSAFMRKMLSDILAEDPGIEVLGTARNGQEAIEGLNRLKPDVITLDVEMPVMGGLSALNEIMKIRPTPVLMISSATQAGAEATLKALQRGAVDFVAKPSGSISLDIGKLGDEIRQKVKLASTVNLSQAPAAVPALRPAPSPPRPAEVKVETGPPRPAAPVAAPKAAPAAAPKPAPPAAPVVPAAPPSALSRPVWSEINKLVVIGTSTGGPKALYEIIPSLPKDLAAGVLIVQHMPPGFTRSLAERLNHASGINVKEAEDGDEVLPGWAYVAPGDYHMSVKTIERAAGKRQLIIELDKGSPVGGHRPDINTMFNSVAKSFWSKIVAVLLTGMGNDGTEGMKKIKAVGGRTIAEDQSTAVVFGIPRSAIEAKVVDRVVPLGQVAHEIVRALSERG
ncbi:MAG: chemotaxis response regulator protein-glutamate methylesterase [Firmicutes bacterium]|nr:chemotaxis response regulator protein-glutamate methylesterase [Bacillota bacterium]